jgi:hypothetical protein
VPLHVRWHAAKRVAHDEARAREPRDEAQLRGAAALPGARLEDGEVFASCETEHAIGDRQHLGLRVVGPDVVRDADEPRDQSQPRRHGQRDRIVRAQEVSDRSSISSGDETQRLDATVQRARTTSHDRCRAQLVRAAARVGGRTTPCVRSSPKVRILPV